MLKMKYISLMVIAATCIQAVYCQKEQNCFLDPSIKNITEAKIQLDRVSSLRNTKFETTSGQYDYTLHICGMSDNVSIVSHKEDVSIPDVKILGRTSSINIMGGSNWVMFNYSGGDKYDNTCNNVSRHSIVMFVCDPDVEHKDDKGLFTLLQEVKTVPCEYRFEVKTPVVCEVIEHGLSGGAIFFILLIVSICCYFIFGFLYRRLALGAQGIEQIPNRPFWFMLGNKFADCANLFCRCDQYCGPGITSGPGSSYDGYSPIEEQMARDLQDDDRDSQLLRP